MTVDYNQVRIEFLDNYLEMFYDESVETKIKGAMSLLYLCFSHENMEYMLDHETLFGTVSRTLRDDFKKSIDLTLYLLNIFQAYSNFTIFHEFLSTNQIGDTTMKIVEHEIKRYVLRVKEYKQAMEAMQQAAGTSKQQEMAEYLQKEEKKLAIMIKKQEKVLFVAFHLLLNLAEDLQIERKMKNRNIIQQLMSMLDRNNPDLLFIVLNFLKKLSIFGDNKNEMKERGFAHKLTRFIPCNNQLLLQIALRLLFNLSFDAEFRMQINDAGLIPKLVEILKAPGFRALILKLLYHLSQEDKLKATFTYTECIPIVYQLIIHCPEAIIGKELIALTVNLTTNPRNAELIAQDEQHEKLVQRAFKCEDTLLFKVCRNVAQFYPASIETLEKYLPHYVEAMMQCGENTDMMVELIGTIVYIPTDKWQEVMQNTGILEFLQSQFMNGYAEDDVILECVMLCGTMCRNDDCAQIIANSYLIRLLQDMLGAKQEDDEMVQQILNTFFKFLFFGPTRELVLNQTQMVSIVLELLSDKNPNIRVLVNAILDYVQAHDDTWRQEIKTKRFYAHNQVFMQLFDEMEKQYPVGGGMGGADYDMYDEMYYDQAAMMQAQQQQEYYGEEDEDGMQGLYVEGLADRIWEDEQQE